jgi:guanine nucleotide-binding protein subunit beta-2-like 1 protein
MGSLKNDKGEDVEFLISGGRDNKVLTWDIHERKPTDIDPEWGTVRKTLSGHSHFVQDLCLSVDSKYALSASWDKTIRLWDVVKGETIETFVDHTKDVLTCSLSADNKQIATGARDKDIKIWNTKGQCKYTVEDKHNDWVSCVRFSPDTKNPLLASGSWDGQIKIFEPLTMALKNTFVGHTNAVTSLAFAHKAMYLASGGKDGNILLWNVAEGAFIKSYQHSEPINQVVFSKIKYWIVAATDNGIIIWDIVSETQLALEQVFKGQDEQEDEENAEEKKKKVTTKVPLACLSIAWNKSGTLLYSGWSDNRIRVYEVVSKAE